MFNKRGQSTLEYAILISVIIAGLWAMQSYVKRGYQGKLKSSADDMGQQFDPTTFSSTISVSQTARVKQTVENKVTTTEQVDPQTSTRTGQEHQGAWDPARNAYGE